MIKSISDNQYQIISDILTLHNNGEGIHLDCTYSKGVFYKKSKGLVKEPLLKTDLYPQTEDTVEASSTFLPFGNNSIKSIMFDPPFVISGKTYTNSKDSSCKIAKRFGCYLSFEELKDHYYNSLKEFNRILVDNGLIIFKCQNTISGGKQYFSHYFIMDSAIKLGFYPTDEFILIAKSKMTSFGENGRWKVQRNAMRYHSYFLVFRKCKNKINYNL